MFTSNLAVIDWLPFTPAGNGSDEPSTVADANDNASQLEICEDLQWLDGPETAELLDELLAV